MADIKLKAGAKASVITLGADLTNLTRKTGDYANSDGWLEADVFLKTKYVTTAPAGGIGVASLWVLFGDGEATESFPSGGDGTVGGDFDPQGILLAGVFETRSPSTTVVETLQLRNVALNGRSGVRFVLKNSSGQTMDDDGFELYIIPKMYQSV